MKQPSDRAVSMGTNKEGTGQLEDIFMEAVPVVHSRKPMSYISDPGTHVDHGKAIFSDKVKEFILPQLSRARKPAPGRNMQLPSRLHSSQQCRSKHDHGKQPKPYKK